MEASVHPRGRKVVLGRNSVPTGGYGGLRGTSGDPKIPDTITVRRRMVGLCHKRPSLPRRAELAVWRLTDRITENHRGRTRRAWRAVRRVVTGCSPAQ